MDVIINKNQFLDKIREFIPIYRQTCPDVHNDFYHFLDQFEGYLDLTNTTAMVEELKGQ